MVNYITTYVFFVNEEDYPTMGEVEVELKLRLMRKCREVEGSILLRDAESQLFWSGSIDELFPEEMVKILNGVQWRRASKAKILFHNKFQLTNRPLRLQWHTIVSKYSEAHGERFAIYD